MCYTHFPKTKRHGRHDWRVTGLSHAFVRLLAEKQEHILAHPYT